MAYIMLSRLWFTRYVGSQSSLFVRMKISRQRVTLFPIFFVWSGTRFPTLDSGIFTISLFLQNKKIEYFVDFYRLDFRSDFVMKNYP